MNEIEIIPIERAEKHILVIRGQKVILDADLARLYNVTTKALNQAVKRNRSRFPIDFLFRLNAKEKKEVVTNCDHLSHLKFSKSAPYAFTEHGALMAASVLNSTRAIEASLFVVRAFVKMREMLSTQKELAQKLTELESRLDGHDENIQALVAAIRQLAAPLKERKGRRLGFKRPEGPVLKQEKTK